MAYVSSGYDSEAIHGQVLRVSSQEDATSLGTSREMKKMCDVEVLKGDWQALEFSEWNCNFSIQSLNTAWDSSIICIKIYCTERGYDTYSNLRR